MKKRLFLAIAMLLAVVCVCANNKQPKRGGQTIYYVVVGSFESLNEAKYFAANAPGDIEWGNVYKAKANGRTVYRVCTGCFYRKADAQGSANYYKNRPYDRVSTWIWANKGLATCVYRASYNNGEAFPIRPE